MQKAGDHSRYAKADCHRKCPSTGSAKMGRISSLTNTDTHRLQANHCRAVDSTGIKAEGEGEWNARKAPSQVLRRNTLSGNGWA
jgi:hypothetical protein